jgi:hypothetical protein
MPIWYHFIVASLLVALAKLLLRSMDGVSPFEFDPSWFVVLFGQLFVFFGKKLAFGHILYVDWLFVACISVVRGIVGIHVPVFVVVDRMLPLVGKVVLKSSFLCPFVVRFLVQNLTCSRTRTNRIRIRSGAVLSSIRSVLSISWALRLLTLQAKVKRITNHC